MLLMAREKGLRSTVAVVALAFGALSLAYGAAQWWHSQNKSPTAKDQAEEERRKRPHSAASSPEQTKRLRTSEEEIPANGFKESGREAIPGFVHDVSALQSAKIAVPDSDQGDPQKLGKHYDAMAAKFASSGLNLSAVRDARKYYQIANGKAEPLVYADFQSPLSRGAVRLGVFRLTNDHPEKLADEAEKATQSILKALPPGSLVHCNSKQHYHTTIQMISHPSDPRPNPFINGGGINRARLPNPIPAPTADVLRKEQDLYREIAAAGFAPVLLVHSVVFADSGSLLMLFTDTTGLVYALRKRLHQAFPGAAEKQPSILHTTLARMLNPVQMSEEERDKVMQSCNYWTNQLRGKKFAPGSLWHVQENTFTYVNVDETSLECRFMRPVDGSP